MAKGKGRGRGRNAQASVGNPPAAQATVTHGGGEKSNKQVVNNPTIKADVNSPISTSRDGPKASKGRGRQRQERRHESFGSDKQSTSTESGSDPLEESHSDVGSSHSDASLNSSFSGEYVMSPGKRPSKFPARPNFGRQGRPISLMSNYFRLQYQGDVIYHYDVEIGSVGYRSQKPARPPAPDKNKMSHIEEQVRGNIGREKRKEIFNAVIKDKTLQKFNPIYDGNKNIFTSKPLPIKSREDFVVEVEFDGKRRSYKVTIQPVKKENGSNIIDMDALSQCLENQNETLMALNAIMNHREPDASQVHIGRSFFYLNQTNKIGLGDGLDIWFGYNQSINFTQKGPALVLNLAAKAFHKAGPMINFLNDVLRCDITRNPNFVRDLKPYQKKSISDAVEKLKVQVTHLPYPRKYTVKYMTLMPANAQMMNVDGKEISVAEYFEKRYKKLKYPYLPCMLMEQSNRNPIYIPIEHCHVLEAQPKLHIKNPYASAAMIKKTAINPEERFQAISQNSREVMKESGETMKKYKLFLDLKMMDVPGRVLCAPAIAHCDSGKSNPDSRGVWRMDGKRLYSTRIEVASWAMLSFSDFCKKETLHAFAAIFEKTASKVGLHFGKFLGARQFGRNQTSEDALKQLQGSKAAFAIIVLSRKDIMHNYDEIKFIADYQLELVTQCMEDEVLNKCIDQINRYKNDQIAVNLCLKINVKLGGTNHTLLQKPKVLSKPAIVLGADVVHGIRGSGCPSISAVVGTLDSVFSKYKLAVQVQDNPNGKISQEKILKMSSMVESILRAFYHNTKGKHPEKIIFFRDGVSEGQFEAVRDWEVTAIQKASQNVFGAILPVTFIVVQKRHSTRFRPNNPRDGVGKGSNVPPGTVVDTDITHPVYFDYFLNSHEGIQGTSKPSHYTVLHDDNDFDADELQELSYHLCYLYGKCNRSISIPAPVMYADLACYRAKKYADFYLRQSRTRPPSIPDYAKEAINKMGDIRNNMFFV